MDAQEIIKLKNQLEGDDIGRHTSYDTVLEATHGRYWDRISTGTWQKWENIIYEPAGANQGDRRQVHVVLNLLNPIVEAKRALWSVVPQVRVPYRSLEDGDTQMSDTLERVYRALWRENRMGEKLGDGGWYAALLGTAIFCVYPDLVKHRPRVVCRSPYGFYGIPANIEADGTEWKAVLFVTKMRDRQAKRMWPKASVSESGSTVNVIEYWDEEQKLTMIEESGEIVEGPVSNRLKLVPVVSVPNISQPGVWWGKGDVQDAIPIINELNKRFNIENQAFGDQAGAPWESIAAKYPKDVSLDPDAINEFEPGGGLKKSQTGGLPWQIYQSNQQLRGYIDAVTDFPEVMRSMFGGSNVSGKAINNLMGPIQARMELRQRYLYPRLEMLNRHMLATWATYWETESQVIYGSIEGERYNFEIVPGDFAGYFENEVFLDSSAYFDVQSKVVVGLQMVAAGGCSIKTFIEKLNPFTDDYAQEKAQMDKEATERIQLAMTAQMMATSPMGMNPQLGAPASDQQSMLRGQATGPTTPEPPPGVSADMLEEGLGEAGMLGGELPQTGASPLTGMLGQGGETTPLPTGGGDQLAHVADLVRMTDKVVGRVFLSGSILDGSIGPEGIEIWFTDMADWATVRQFVAKQDPTLSGQFNPQQGIPNVDFLEVTPGTSGYEVQSAGTLQEEGLSAVPPGLPLQGTMAGPAGTPAAPFPPDLGGI